MSSDDSNENHIPEKHIVLSASEDGDTKAPTPIASSIGQGDNERTSLGSRDSQTEEQTVEAKAVSSSEPEATSELALAEQSSEGKAEVQKEEPVSAPPPLDPLGGFKYRGKGSGPVMGAVKRPPKPK